MSYCVNCGVELADNLEKCPLCGVRSVNPAAPDRAPGAPSFPAEAVMHITPRVRRTAAFAAAVLLLIPLVSTHVCDIAINGGLTWSRFVVAGYFILYGIVFPPFFITRHRVTYSMAIGYVALSAALWVFCRLSGGEWFWRFALPLTTVSSAMVYAVYLLVRHTPWNLLKIGSAVLGGIGLATLFVEWLINSTFYSGKPLLWSLITVVPCVLLSAAFAIVESNPALKQAIKRRFFF